jgi:hypothetical protein
VPVVPSLPTPEGPSAAEQAQTQALSDYQKNIAMSQDELNTQADLDRLNESTRKAFTGIGDQTMPLEFITGQQRSVEQRALDLAEPLNAKMARLQAQRQAALDASKFALDRADKKVADEKAVAQKAKEDAAKKAEPISVGAGQTVVHWNPETKAYETVYKAPEKTTPAEGFTLSEGQRRYDAAGNLIAAGPAKQGEVRESGGYLYQQQTDGSWKVVGGNGPAGSSGKVVNINGTDYVQNADGTFSAPNLPTTPQSTEKIDTLKQKVALIDSLLTSKGLAGSVGPYGVSRWTPFTADKAERKEFAAGVNQLIGQETIDTLLNLKKQGGTLGALSDNERFMLQSAASKIGSWQIKDAQGNPTGEYEVSEDAFKAELNRIKELTQKAIDQAGGGPKPLNTNDPQVQYLRQQGLSDDEIRALGFSQDLGTSEKGLDVSKVTAAIGQFESGGNYRAMGPVTSSGDRAYGKYQIMGNNIPSWSKEILGQSISVAQFLANPQLQDQIAAAKIGQYIQKYGTVEDAASMWFSGRPLAKAGNAKDVIGTTVPQYAKNVRSIYDRLA